MQPVGPLPASTYWRRRAVLVLGALVVLLLLRSCAGGGHPAKKATPRLTPSPTAPASPRPTATTPPVVTAGGSCPDNALQLAVSTDAATYAVGATVRFTLTVTNTAGTACTRDLGSKAVSLQVVSGSARTWNSDDCTQALDSRPTMLAPGKATEVVSLAWSGKRSRPGCPTPREQASAGTYQVSGTVGTLTSARAVFHFR